MTELRVVGGLFRDCHPVDGRVLIGSDLPYGFVYRYRTAHRFGSYAPYRGDARLAHRLDGIFHRRSHRGVDFRFPDDR